MIAERDTVVTRWTYRGTPATAKQLTFTGITIHRLADGRIEEEWSNWDGLEDQ